jgi:hypothetical protein
VYSAGDADGRAGLVVCAYLMRLNDWSLETAFLNFKHKSPLFSPNVSMLARLGEYETAFSGTRHLEEYMEERESGTKGKEQVSAELQYVRRQQVYHLEDELAERAAIAAEEEEEEEEEEEDLC